MKTAPRTTDIAFYSDPERLCRGDEPRLALENERRDELRKAFNALRKGELSEADAEALCTSIEREGVDGLFVRQSDLVATEEPPTAEPVIGLAGTGNACKPAGAERREINP